MASVQNRQDGQAGAGQVGLSARVNFWSTVITAFAAAAALGLSCITYWQINSRPELDISMPRQIQMAAYNVGGPQFCMVIPAGFQVSRKSDLTTVVLDGSVRLDPTPGGGSQALSMFWSGTVTYGDSQNDNPATTTPGLTSRLQGIAIPFAVGPDTDAPSAMQYCTIGASSVVVTPGQWTGKLSIQPYEEDPVEADFCVRISDRVAQNFNDAINKASVSLAWWAYRQGLVSQQKDAHKCYTA